MKASSAEMIAAKLELLDELKEVLRSQQGKRLYSRIHKEEEDDEEEEGEEKQEASGSDSARLKAVAAEKE